MDGFVDELMEKVFTKGETEYAFDDETRQLMNKIRQKIRDSPRCQISSSNTDDYCRNLFQRISVETDDRKKRILIDQYNQIITDKQLIESLCG